VHRRRVGLVLLALHAAVPCAAVARPCGGDDLEVIEALWAQLTGSAAGGSSWDAASLDDRAVEQLAEEAGCEWLAGPGGPAEELDRLRWREGTAWPAAEDADRGSSAARWWRMLLPRIELRWVGRIEDGALSAGSHDGWTGRFELWLLWSLGPAP
jgi:hypothetical protein